MTRRKTSLHVEGLSTYLALIKCFLLPSCLEFRPMVLGTSLATRSASYCHAGERSTQQRQDNPLPKRHQAEERGGEDHVPPGVGEGGCGRNGGAEDRPDRRRAVEEGPDVCVAPLAAQSARRRGG